jgi:hypothetical protein
VYPDTISLATESADAEIGWHKMREGLLLATLSTLVCYENLREWKLHSFLVLIMCLDYYRESIEKFYSM